MRRQDPSRRRLAVNLAIFWATFAETYHVPFTIAVVGVFVGGAKLALDTLRMAHAGPISALATLGVAAIVVVIGRTMLSRRKPRPCVAEQGRPTPSHATAVLISTTSTAPPRATATSPVPAIAAGRVPPAAPPPANRAAGDAG